MLQTQLHAARIHHLSFRRELRRRDLFNSSRKVAKSKPLHKIESMRTASVETAESSLPTGTLGKEGAVCLDIREIASKVKDVYAEKGGGATTQSFSRKARLSSHH